MKKMMTAFAAISLAMGVAACGDNDEAEVVEAASDGTISGDWLADVDSAQIENDNRDYMLSDGTFACNSCTPPYEVTLTAGFLSQQAGDPFRCSARGNTARRGKDDLAVAPCLA